MGSSPASYHLQGKEMKLTKEQVAEIETLLSGNDVPGLTQKEIAGMYKITQGRISQIKKAMKQKEPIVNE